MRLIDGMKVLLMVATVLLAGLCSSASAQECLNYWPAVVTLTGTLRAQVFPGPPNYESIRRGDRRERAIILTLASRTCMTGKESDDLDVPESNIREMQLVVTKSAHWKTVERRLGKRVTVTGTLFHGFNGHHRTKVFVTVTNIRAAA